MDISIFGGMDILNFRRYGYSQFSVVWIFSISGGMEMRIQILNFEVTHKHERRGSGEIRTERT